MQIGLTNITSPIHQEKVSQYFLKKNTNVASKSKISLLKCSTLQIENLNIQKCLGQPRLGKLK
jgi:hypothetical protein